MINRNSYIRVSINGQLTPTKTKIMIHTDSHDPAFRFEGLLREAFQCGKGQDPFGNAMQERFSCFVGSITEEGRRALSTAFVKLVLDYPDSKDDFIKLDDKVWKASTQDDIIDIIDQGIKILKRIKSN